MLSPSFRLEKVFIFIFMFLLIVGQILPSTGTESHLQLLPRSQLKDDMSPAGNVVYAFPGEIVNTTVYLGVNRPQVSYYEVTLTLNSSAFETVNALPVYGTTSNESGYFIRVSFACPNDQPGTWWNLGYELFPLENQTVESLKEDTITASGSEINITSKSSGYMSGFFAVSGKVILSFTENVTSVVLYPENTQNYTVVSTQVNRWTYSNSQLVIYFSLYDYIDSSGSIVPPAVTVELGYYVNQSYTIPGSSTTGSTGVLELVQGNGAYIMGITSSQMVQILSSINQTLSVPVSQLNAAVVSINGDVATVETSFGSMLTSLNNINASLKNVSKGEAFLSTDIGNLEVPLTSINATISSIRTNTVILETDLGEVQTSLLNLNASVSSVRNGIAYLTTSLGSLKVPLSDLNATVEKVENGTAILIGSLGSMEASLKSINSTLVELSGENATLETSLGIVYLSLKELNATVTSYGSSISRLNGSMVYINTTIGNISGTVTKIYNNTAVIETAFGNVTESIGNIKEQVTKDNTATKDPLSPFYLVMMAMLGAAIFLSLLAVFDTRNILKIISGKEK
ncbi:MAG: hypothetical protein QXM60_02320 [Thermoplasmatales archaeon]